MGRRGLVCTVVVDPTHVKEAADSEEEEVGHHEGWDHVGRQVGEPVGRGDDVDVLLFQGLSNACLN